MSSSSSDGEYGYLGLILQEQSMFLNQINRINLSTSSPFPLFDLQARIVVCEEEQLTQEDLERAYSLKGESQVVILAHQYFIFTASQL